jgi:uncharacterized membrane protein
MNWLQRYRLRHYFWNSVWVFPVLGMVLAIAAVRLLHWLEREMGWISPVHPDTARAVLATMASSLFTSVVFVCTALLVAVQLASAALTPRIIALVFRDPVTKLSLTVLVFTFTFCLSALIRIVSTVPLLTAHLAAYTCVLSLCAFFYLIDHLGKSLRPSGALRGVARMGRNVVNTVYPRLLDKSLEGPEPNPTSLPAGKPPVTIGSPGDGVVLAFDEAGLLSLAVRGNCVIELVPQVGDHIAVGDPLFRVFQAEGTTIPASALCHSVALGQERTLQQDATFAFRIMVDIASKALSPAINDPTTAVLSLDQIHHLLRMVGNRYLDTGRVCDPQGRLRLVYRTPDWEDFVRLSVTEIRHFGAESIQIARRLHAMLENLIQTLPEPRTALLRQELALLHRSAERFFSEPEDRALAEVGDFQGVGGKNEDKRRGMDT